MRAALFPIRTRTLNFNVASGCNILHIHQMETAVAKFYLKADS